MFQVNQLTGFGGGEQAPALPSKSFQATTFDGTSQTTYTFAGQNIGSASSTRYVIVAAALTASASRTISSVTVGGISATAIVTDDVTNFFFYRLSLYIVAVPTGSTASVVVTASGACDAAAISVWAAYDLNSATAVDSDVSPDSVSPFDVPSMSTSADGILVAATTYFSDAGSVAWTNATERSDLSSSFSGAFSGNSAADALTTGAGVALISTITASGFDAGLVIGATFR